jgi:D-3-phosphoglycerate dehydrogenase
MIGVRQLAQMKPDAVLLNYARSGLVDNKAVLEALESGKLGKYVTDFPDDELLGNPNVIATPHLGASTPEAEENCARMAAKQLADYLENGNITNSVNFPDVVIPRGEGYRICIINKNVANMVGQVTSVLAEENYNIEHMMNRSRGAWAYTMIDVLDEPSSAVIGKIEAIDGIIKVRVIEQAS